MKKWRGAWNAKQKTLQFFIDKVKYEISNSLVTVQS